MSRFNAGLKDFAKQVITVTQETFAGTVKGVNESVVNGSGLTGSPGQPHDLRRGEWTVTPNGPWNATISTDDKSARSVEDGISYKHGTQLKKLKSHEGGFHSVKISLINSDKIVAQASRQADA